MNFEHSNTIFSKRNLILKIFLLFFLVLEGQNSLDSLTFHQIEELVVLDKKEQASKLLTKSLKALSSLSNNKNELANEYEKYRIYFQKITTNPDIRKEYCDDLIRLRENAKNLDSLGLVNSYFYAANDAHQLKKYNIESLNYIEKGIFYWEKFYTKPTDLYAQMLTQKGASLHNNSLTYEAFSTNEHTLKVYESINKPDKSILYSLSIQLAKSYTKFGFYKKAKYHLRKADHILRSEAERFEEADKIIQVVNGYQLYLLSTYSRYYRDIQDEKKLLENIKRADDFSKGKKLVSWAEYYYAETYNYAGFYYLYLKKDYEKAFEMFKQARENIDPNYNRIYLDYYEMNMVRALIELHKQDQALSTLKKLENNRLPSSLKGIVYMTKAYIFAKKNHTALVVKSVNKGLSIFGKTKKELDILSDNVLMDFKPTGELYDTNHYLKLANEIRKEKNKNDTQKILVNNLYKVALLQFKSSYQKNVYSKVLEEMYNTIVDGILKSNKERYGKLILKSNNFLENLITDKSSFLWHKFLVNRNSDALKIPDSLSIREQNLRKRLLLYQQAFKQNSKDSLLAFNIEEVKEKLEILSNQLHTGYENFTLFDNHKFSLKDFQSNLKENEIVLNYVVLNASLYLIKITNNDLDIENLGNYSKINTTIFSFVSMLSNIKESYENITKTGMNLYNELVPVNISNFNKITIVPDKALHYFPFEVLTNNDQEYVIKNHNIKYSISLPILNFYEPNDNSKRKPMLFSPDYNNQDEKTPTLALRNSNSNLLGAQEEARTISKLINGSLFAGNNATKEKFKENSKNASILHLAMHALIDDENPALSNFIFSKTTPDNKVYLSELYGLNLNTNLVVLAACNTGIGKEKAGEGMISLNRAFTYAGVPTTVSSLWSLPDTSTKEIMIDFYKNIKKNQSTSVALRNAKISYISNQNNQNRLHPLFWSGLVHHGKDLTIDFSNRYSVLIYAILLILAGVILFFRIYKKS